ncbi:hypothetical protein OpiT1DRAFT_05477 [Opitutaceae bacterium TAV1]|nr:hypothetical protein OpiT1DRAFT_05477 [Opitutaceae bacterium TAV1]
MTIINSIKHFVTIAVALAALIKPAKAVQFTDNFQSYSTKEELMAVYNIVYTGKATADNWDIVENGLRFANLTGGMGIFFYLTGKIEDTTPGATTANAVVTAADFGTITSGDKHLFGVRVETAGGDYAYTALGVGTYTYAHAQHTGANRASLYARPMSAVLQVSSAGGTWNTWRHRTSYSDPNFWNTEQSIYRNAFSFTNDDTNKVGFFISINGTGGANGVIIGSFSVDLVSPPPIPEPSAVAALMGAAILLTSAVARRLTK